MDTTAPVSAADAPPAADRVIAVVLFIALGLISPIMSFYGLMFGMVSDGCMGAASCNGDQIGQGVILAALAPWIGLVAGGIIAATAVS